MTTMQCITPGCPNKCAEEHTEHCLLHSSDRGKPPDKFALILKDAIDVLGRYRYHAEIHGIVFPKGNVQIPASYFSRPISIKDANCSASRVIITNGTLAHDLAFIGGQLRAQFVFRKTMLRNARLAFGPFEGECEFDFSGLTISENARVDLSHAYIGVSSFEAITIETLRRHFTFHNTSWNRRRRLLHRRVLLKESTVLCRKLQLESEGLARKYSHLSREYGKLEMLFEEIGEHSSAVAFHYSRMDLYRRSLCARVLYGLGKWQHSKRDRHSSASEQVFENGEESSRLRFISDLSVLTLFWLVSGYNDRYARAGGWLLILLSLLWLTFFFGGLSLPSGLIDYDVSLNPRSLSFLADYRFWSDANECTKYTLAHLFFRIPEHCRPLSLAGHVVSMVGSLLCPMTLALMVLSMRRVFRSAHA